MDFVVRVSVAKLKGNEVADLSTQWLIGSRTYRLSGLSVAEPIDSVAYRSPNLSAQWLIGRRTYRPSGLSVAKPIGSVAYT
jgi:hypothetical protein